MLAPMTDEMSFDDYEDIDDARDSVRSGARNRVQSRLLLLFVLAVAMVSAFVLGLTYVGIGLAFMAFITLGFTLDAAHIRRHPDAIIFPESDRDAGFHDIK